MFFNKSIMNRLWLKEIFISDLKPMFQLKVE